MTTTPTLMIDLSEVSPENLITTVAPIPMPEIRKYFADKAKVFLIDYAGSQLNGRGLLTYLSNLDVPCDLTFGDTVTKEQKFDLLREYMTLRNLCHIPTLNIAVATILFKQKQVNIVTSEFVNQPLLSDEEIVEFISLNEEVVNRWVLFLDSLMLFLLTTVRSSEHATVGIFEEAFPRIFRKYEHVDDPLFIGTNVVNLFNIPSFLELFLSVPPKEMKFFTRQFSEYMFKGRNLFYWFSLRPNVFLKLVQGIAVGAIKAQDVIGMRDKYTDQQQDSAAQGDANATSV